MRRDRQRLQDILEAIERIERVAVQGKSAFEDDEMIQVWILHHVQIIGEAARGLSEDFRKEHSHIPWSVIVGMRNILVHDYFGIDPEEVWSAVERDLPALRDEVERILARNP
ncbi:MAG: DUF86 domain-containing protein [Acidobacteriota bacterium]